MLKCSGMRFFVTLLTALGVMMLYLLNQPAEYYLAREKAAQALKSLLYSRELRIVGLHFLEREVVEAALPNKASNVWWLVNQRALQAHLLSNPLIESATLARCPGRIWGCFEITVNERKPAFVALLGAEAWLVGSDGGLMFPVNVSQLAALSAEYGNINIPQVSGIVLDDASPDLASARLHGILEALTVIQQAAARPIRKANLLDNGEAEVWFQNLKPKAIFEFKTSGCCEAINKEALIDRAVRLNRLIAKLGRSIEWLESIDLVFDKIAVARPRF